MADIKEFLTEDRLEKIKDLRMELHNNPEKSGEENKTRDIIYNFLKENTVLNIKLRGDIVFAYCDVKADTTIAIRSDHDAITGEDGKAFHGCGHDGHTAIACGLAMIVEELNIGKNTLFIFQPSEEDGRGAKMCLPLLEEFNVDYIYGFHNFPGYKEGLPILKAGTFMCASVGMEITFKGKQSHASDPELGINPAYGISKLINYLEPLASTEGYKDFAFDENVFVTITHTKVGNDGTYGVSPSLGKVQMTLRAYKLEELNKLRADIEVKAREIADFYGLSYEISYDDEFPDTSNPNYQVEFLEEIFDDNNIETIHWEEPYRASEDFGWYLKEVDGCYFGIGTGEDLASLHHSDYIFNDRIIYPTIQYLAWIIKRIKKRNL